MSTEDSTGKQKKQRVSTPMILAYFIGTAIGTFILMICIHRVILILNNRKDGVSSPSLSTAQSIAQSSSPQLIDNNSQTTLVESTRPIITESKKIPLLETSKIQQKAMKKNPFAVHEEHEDTPQVIESASSSKVGTVSIPSMTANDKDHPSIKTDTETMKQHPPRDANSNSQQSTITKENSILTNSIICPNSMLKRYQEIPNAEAISADLKWCQRTAGQYGVKIGRSWGSLGPDGRFQWDEKKCNELLSLGKLQACSERWGWEYYDNWMNNTFDVLVGGSRITCMVDVKTTTYCKMSNVTIDFGKARAEGVSRSFRPGFLNFYGTPTVNYGKIPPYPGIQHHAKENTPSPDDGYCEEMEERPTFILSNDDIFNLGHYMNDVMGIWSMFTSANHYPDQSLMINMDGIRAGGPAGGSAHRLMLTHSPDNHGPYSEHYYHKWFQEVKKGIEYGQKRICFRSLYLFPLPGVPWFWNNWGRVDECSVVSQSPLYQSFNVYLRQRIIDDFVASSKQVSSAVNINEILPNPPTDKIHIVIEVRKINPKKQNNHSSSRYIANLVELVAALSSLPNVKVTAQDFAQLSFMEQIKLAHSASILVSMHGAGTTHIFHMAVGQKNCCGLLELFPDTTIELHAAQGYGNLARMLGFHHVRYVAERGNTRPTGTIVNVRKLKDIVANMTRNVAREPTCLLDVKDTRFPVYGNSRRVFEFDDSLSEKNRD